MHEAIETVPSDGGHLSSSRTLRAGADAVARWSAEAGDRVGEKGEPIEITPTHWHPMPGKQSHPQEDNKSGAAAPPGPPPSRRRRFRVFAFAASRAAPRQPVAARRRLAAFTVAAAALIGTSFDTHKALANDAAEIKRTAESIATELRQSLQQERDRAEALARDLATTRREIDTITALTSKADEDAAQIMQALERTATELRQSLQRERDRAEALARDLATARREIETHTAALASKAGDDGGTDQAGRRKRRGGVATVPAEGAQQGRGAGTVSRDSATRDRQAGSAGKQGGRRRGTDQAGRGKRRDGVATVPARGARQGRGAGAGSRDSAARDRNAHSAGEQGRRRRGTDQAGCGKHRDGAATVPARRSATGPRRWHSELATAQREIDKQTALASKAGDDAAQIKQAAESAAAELRQSLQQERDRAEALAQSARDGATRDRRADGAGEQGGRRRGTDQAGCRKHRGGAATVPARGARQGRGAGTANSRRRSARSKRTQRWRARPATTRHRSSGCGRHRDGAATVPAKGARQGRGAGTVDSRRRNARSKRRRRWRARPATTRRRSSGLRKAPRRSCDSPCKGSATGPRRWPGSRDGAPRDRHAGGAGKQGGRRRGTDQAGCRKHHGGVATVPASRSATRPRRWRSDLAKARREIDTYAGAGEQGGRRGGTDQGAAENAKAELRQSLQQERDQGRGAGAGS